jgi:hypothetical protein
MRLLFAATVVLAACLPAPEAESQSPSSSSGSVSAPSLYLTDSLSGAGLVAVDPISLRDLSAKPLLSIGDDRSNPCRAAAGPCALITASTNSSTLAVVHYSTLGAAGISIFDARSGKLRAKPIPEVPVVIDALSSDGSRIYARNWPPQQIGAERLVLDAQSGKVLEREPAFSLEGDPIAWVSGDERRLYVLTVPSDARATGPRAVDVGAWDLRTGREVWRLRLPSLLGGNWETGRAGVGGVANRTRLVPGIALSPDGTRLAVVAGCCVANGALWLVDTSRGALLAQRTYARAPSILERLFAPSIAAAKEEDDVAFSASFAADGRVIHVHAQSQKAETGYLYMGMAAVELETATVLGSDIKMELWWYQNRVHWTRSSSDGKWLYVFLERTGNADPKGYVLRRLDARTLRIQAERWFDSYRYSFLLAAP